MEDLFKEMWAKVSGKEMCKTVELSDEVSQRRIAQAERELRRDLAAIRRRKEPSEKTLKRLCRGN